ncbi:hypothetical protein BDV25DRAFT_130058 [Aspergillus avenaceus]|uniref:DUF676 domain-containing protein n=1 Tax=Aspergillus avenaceus TaxID=36643 RepID=A0A5N6TTZ9_ASPAV|nr:hypothetical protein BDV25DRAFT_130058 [Aspergillus avenaceus]
MQWHLQCYDDIRIYSLPSHNINRFLLKSGIKTNTLTRNAGKAPKSKFGIVEVKTDGLGSHCRDNGVDIIFVHGLGSNPDTTWSARKCETIPLPDIEKEDVCWITDFLPKDIPSPLRENVRLYFYNYDSFWKRDAVQTRLYRLGGEMLNRLRQIRGKEEERTRDLIFVAHSYGGLVIKEALIQASVDKDFADISKHVKAVLFLGTPHRGSSFSSWGKLLASFLRPLSSNPSILEELTYDCLFLHELHEKFVKAATKVQQIINFFEQRKTQILKVGWLSWEEFCVREQSATFTSIPNQLTQIKNIGLTVDHYGLNKFSSREGNFDLIYKELWGSIEPIIPLRQCSLYSVPLKLVASFTERASLSDQIQRNLYNNYPARPRPYATAICGLGGTGKTQLALKYIEDHKHNFDTIQIGRKGTQGLHPRDSPAVQAVSRWLQCRKRSDGEWLVVFDNVDNLSWSIFDILPQGQQGNIIITSQNEQSSKLLKCCEKVSVDILNRHEARALLLWHLDHNRDCLGQDIEDLCDQVAERLEFLPLAVDLAGAYMGNDKTDPKFGLIQYLDDYGKYQNELLQSDQYNGLSGYDKTRIEEKHPNRHAKSLLIFLSHFASGIIQNELFRLASLGLPSVKQSILAEDEEFPSWFKLLLTVDGERWDDFHFRRARGLLISYGLLKPVDEEWPGVRMHSLVRWRAKQYKEDHRQNLWACHEHLRTGRPHFHRHIAVHVSQASTNLGELTDDNVKLETWAIFGDAYQRAGQWPEAEEFRKSHPLTLTSINRLGVTYERRGKYADAEALFRKALEGRKESTWFRASRHVN